MYLCDSHTHSLYSYDSDSPLSEMCEKAIENGLSEICVTDHYDANIDTGPEPMYNAAEAEERIKNAAAEYAGRLTVTYGLELGEPHELPERTRDILSSHGFEFIIGSLHNARGEPDYYVVKFEKMSDGEFRKTMDAYFEQNLEMLEFGGFDSLGHLGYPWRLSEGKGHPADPERHRAAIEEIFRRMIKDGVALEVNTSSLRSGFKTSHPTPLMLEWYRGLGGRMITVGSDAHYAKHIGAGIPETHRMLRGLGFTEFTVFRARRPVQMKLSEI